MHFVRRPLGRHLWLTLALLPGLVSAHDLEIHGSNTIGATLAPMLVTGF